MRKVLLACLFLVILTGCGGEEKDPLSYSQITMEELAEKLEEKGDYLLVDVRTMQEYEEGHIPGAVCIPNESIAAGETDGLPQKDQLIYLYCRSGNRSKQAAESLVEMGYSNIVECGGIIDWTGAVVTGNE